MEQMYMKRCLELAQKGQFHTSPNPMVGCVIVYNDRIIGEGYHRRAGGPHAEAEAIAQVKDPALLKDSTLYVSLEPCSHYGKTPPCADLIIQHEIPRVIIAAADPHKKVAGKGMERMRKAGISVDLGLLEKESRILNRRFNCFHQRGRPYIILKWAQSPEGFMDIKRSEGKRGQFAITSPEMRQWSHRWRAEEDAILVGYNTALNDNPSLNTRVVEGPSPIKLLWDQHGALPDNLQLFKGKPVIRFSQKPPPHLHPNEHWVSQGRDPVQATLDWAREAHCLSILVEGGRATLDTFLKKGVYDEIRVLTGTKGIADGLPAPAIPPGHVQHEHVDWQNGECIDLYRYMP